MKRFCSVVLAAVLAFALVIPASALSVEDAKQLLEEYYIDELPENIDSFQTLEELLAALNDPYTSYLSAEQYARLMTSINGDMVVGIGATINTTFENGGFEILSILSGSPALEAGLLPGDVITAVDGMELTASMDPTTYIRGDAGTTVKLTVRRTNGELVDIILVRRAVDIPIVTYEKTGSIGYIDCTSFGESTIATVMEALEKLDSQVSVWVMDLRSNPGGTSTAASGSAGLFLGPGIMSFFRDGNGEYNYVYTTSSCPDLTDKPLIILTSPQSASGSELFAAAIRDYKAGIAVGQRTFGKGVAQLLFDESANPEMFDGDCLRITVYRFFSPAGATNHIVGVLPTLLISDANVEAVAELLSCGYSPYPENHLKINLAGQTLCVNLFKALEPEYKGALTELLEALPPSAKIVYSTGKNWDESPTYSPADLAAELGLPFQSRSFTDIGSSRFKDAIDTLACYGLLSGYGDGTYRPDRAITRAEFCAMVSTALDLPVSSNGVKFSDVASDAWYAQAVSAMASRGFISGYGNGTFRPNATITTQEIAAIMSKVAQWACMDAFDYASYEADPTDHSYDAFSPWARDAARILDLMGALPDGLTPTAAGDRQTAAGMLYAMMESSHLLWD